MLREVLFDPTSAIVEHSAPERGWYRLGFSTIKFAWIVSGRVNAKNRFGGYVGFRGFQLWFLGEQPVALALASESGWGIGVDAEFNGGGLSRERAGLQKAVPGETR